MYFIPINLKSIRKNPDYSPPDIMQDAPGNQEVTFSCDKLPPCLVEDENCVIIEWKEKDGEKYDISGNILIKIDTDFMKSIKKESKKYNLNVNIQCHRIEVSAFGSPLYLFKYKNIKVKCKECSKSFMSNEFKSFETDGCPTCGCGYGYTYTGCPHCGEWDCCEVKYETVDDALERKNK